MYVYSLCIQHCTCAYDSAAEVAQCPAQSLQGHGSVSQLEIGGACQGKEEASAGGSPGERRWSVRQPRQTLEREGERETISFSGFIHLSTQSTVLLKSYII